MKTTAAALISLLALFCSGVGTGTTSPGHVTYFLQVNRYVYRLAARVGAHPQDVSLALNALSRGRDEWLNTSPDGRSLLLSSERFGCGGWACLALVSSDSKRGQAIRAGGGVIHSEGFGAVASGGALVVYPSEDGPHHIDLWAADKGSGRWQAPRLLIEQ